MGPAIATHCCKEELKKGYNSLADDAAKEVATKAAKELHLACAFIANADKRRCGKSQEELENTFTKGNNDHSKDMVIACSLLINYKNWQPRSTVESEGVAFAQCRNQNKNKNN